MCSIPYLFIGGIHTAVAWCVSGIPFDMIHGVSNFVLMLVLYKPLRRVLEHCVVRNDRMYTLHSIVEEPNGKW